MSPRRGRDGSPYHVCGEDIWACARSVGRSAAREFSYSAGANLIVSKEADRPPAGSNGPSDGRGVALPSDRRRPSNRLTSTTLEVQVRDAIPLGRIAGFPVNVHWSVLVILWLFTWSLASTLPGTVRGYSPVAYWAAGACGALVLLASLVAHELAHAVVARRAGVAVGSVTLWLFGGVTTLGGEAKTPRAAFRIAIAGPATSLALAALFGGLVAALPTLGAAPSWSASPPGWPASTCCWACSICCRAHPWTVAGCCGRSCGAATATACAPASEPRTRDGWSRSS